MSTEPSSRILHNIADGSGRTVLDVGGVTVEFLTGPLDAPGDFCVMRGMIPPGAVIPIHSHDSTETFLVISGTQQALVPGDNGLEWKDARAGDYLQIASGQAHALRNVSSEPVIELIVTSPRLGEWFEEAGRPVTGDPGPPTPDDLPACSRCPQSMATGSVPRKRTPPQGSGCLGNPSSARAGPHSDDRPDRHFLTPRPGLPRGDVVVDAARGFEYEPLRQTARIEPGQRDLTLRIGRVADMASEGWWSGDSHVHFLSTPGAQLEQRGEDLRVVNLLQTQWGALFANTEDFSGRPSVVDGGGYVTYVG